MTRAPKRKYSGVAAVEFAIVLPLLTLLVLSLVDVARALETQIVLVNLSREGASLASRASLEYTSQEIMDALTSTTPSLEMKKRGMIYITQVIGYKDSGGSVRNVVVGQYRWKQGWDANGYAARSKVWNCGDGNTRWLSDGSCGNIATPGPTASVMTGQLAEGDMIYAVEAFYNFNTFFGDLDLGFGLKTYKIGPDLYSMTVL